MDNNKPASPLPQGMDPNKVIGKATPLTRADYRRLERLPYRLTQSEEDNLPVIVHRKSGSIKLICKSNDGIRAAIGLTQHGRVRLKDGLIPVTKAELGRLREVEMEGRHREAREHIRKASEKVRGDAPIVEKAPEIPSDDSSETA